ncbi:uncharacterized protein LOC144108077 [Amblyomma americanum]
MPSLLLSATVVLGAVLIGCAQSASVADHDAVAVETDDAGPDHDASAVERPDGDTASEGRKGTAEELDSDNISSAWDRHRFVEFFLEVLWELLVILYQEYMFETYVTVLQQSDWFPDSPLMQIVLVVVPFALSLVVVQYCCPGRKKPSVLSGPQSQPSPSQSATATGLETMGSTVHDESSNHSSTEGAVRREASSAAIYSSDDELPIQKHKWAEEVECAVIATGLEKCDVTRDVNTCGVSSINHASSDDAARPSTPLSPAVRGSMRRGLKCRAAPMVTSSHRLAQMSFRLDNHAD